MEPLVDTSEELKELAEIEGATSNRLLSQNGEVSSVPATELVYSVPHANFINASFAYAKPGEPNRFNGANRGAWYAALSVETCLAEVIHHMTEVLDAVGDFNATVEYCEMYASFAGEFLDLRTSAPDVPYLSPDKAIGYPAGNALADTARAQGLNGIVYPSVRHLGGTCLVALWPHAVQSVAQGDIYRVEWTGSPKATIIRV